MSQITMARLVVRNDEAVGSSPTSSNKFAAPCIVQSWSGHHCSPCSLLYRMIFRRPQHSGILLSGKGVAAIVCKTFAGSGRRLPLGKRAITHPKE